MCTSTRNKPANLPEALAVTLLVVGWRWRVEMAVGGLLLETIRHDSGRPAVAPLRQVMQMC